MVGICLKVIGGILFVCMLFFVGLFVIFYGEIENYLKKIEKFLDDDESIGKFVVCVIVLLDYLYGVIDVLGVVIFCCSSVLIILSGLGVFGFKC